MTSRGPTTGLVPLSRHRSYPFDSAFSNTSRLFALALLILGWNSACEAKDWYIADSTTGKSSGLSASDAKAYAFFNDPDNWGTGGSQIGPGDVIHLVGTVAHQLVFQGDGAPNLPITLLFDPGARMSAPVWPSNNIAAQPADGAVVVNHHDFITINGDIRNGRQGVIENTANGTGLANHCSSIFVNGTSSSHLTVENLSLLNAYRRTNLTDPDNYGVAVMDNSKDNTSYTDFIVRNCLIHDACIGIWCDIPSGGQTLDTVDWSFNSIYNTNWGCAIGDRGTGTATRISIHDNRILRFSLWDDVKNNNNHHNGIFAFCVNRGHIKFIRVYNNVIGPSFGGNATAGLFLEGDVSSLVFNNIFLLGAHDTPNDGAIAVQNRPGCNPIHRLYNNSIVGGGDGIGIYANAEKIGTTTVYIQNNLISNVGTNIAIFSNRLVSAKIDHNIGFRAQRGTEYSLSTSNSAGFMTFAQWRDAGFDPHGLESDPSLDANWYPTGSSAAIGNGANESVYFRTDIDQVVRPMGGAWDIGAKQTRR
jgi:hypothetical protein